MAESPSPTIYRLKLFLKSVDAITNDVSLASFHCERLTGSEKQFESADAVTASLVGFLRS